ncbi:peptidoglycan-binding protein [filamentous cyanobacterium LEGE 11480]|uniref:Peptidoglycan-binding protein n=1 Tax=Romeriopsis navalis LEGE 11480 TaxID=2777977 RepID=A0A928VNZ6_9CYAN|nr:peptidoglycan-binding protein [Romeriopsis navalis]MBE9030221.1 peptidoglycan-binding protein [Romeriopsis navalis LEGE 11480]
MAFNASALGLKTIFQGSWGDVVTGWQRFLASKKYPVGVADGAFGRATDLATKDYQKANDLGADGVVGTKTYQVALRQGLIFFLPNLTAWRLLEGLNFGPEDIKDLQRVLNTVLTVKPEPNYPRRPPLAVDGAFGFGSTTGMVEVYRELDDKFRETINSRLSDATKSRVGQKDFHIAMSILNEYTRRLRVRLSGPEWQQQFLFSDSLEDLTFPFRIYAQEFMQALKDAGATVEISNTYRPPERAYLMHYCVKIANRWTNAGNVPSFPGVGIDWVHYTNEISVWWAEKMAIAYDIAYPPALRSNHTVGRAIDWYIEWEGTLKIKNLSGRVVEIGSPRNSFDNYRLWDVGATYGVYKLAADPPHWSFDGY